MDPPSAETFERCALASGLIGQRDVDEALAALRWSAHRPPDTAGPPTGAQLAEKLVEMGRLNSWQADQLLAGRSRFTLGPYRIVDSIGQGGMGQVFKGEHSGTGQVVAIKVLPRDKSTPEAIHNFSREILALAKLDHPNLVRKLDSGHDGNVYYLVTEYVPGTDLRKLVRRHGPLGMQSAASIISQAAEGLDHAHQQGMIHRDVKPGNILVTPDGVAKLSDLGLAASLNRDVEEDPRHGRIVGTADYLSPDHIRFPRQPTPAWDIYSLGCTFYYAVTGKVPFPGGTISDKARAHCELRPLDPRRLNPELSSELVDVIADMMAKDPAERIHSAADVIARLSPWTGVPIPPAASEAARARLSRRGQPAKTLQPAVPDASDTKSNLPDMPELRPETHEGSGQVSQTTYPASAAAQGTFSAMNAADAQADQPLPIWGPLAVLVVTPLLLVGGVMLVQWLLRLFE